MSQDLPFEAIRDEIETLPIAVANKIEREWPQKWQGVTDAWLVLSGTVRVAANTYSSIRYLCADSPPDPKRKPEYSASVPPLARTILDSLFTVVFLFEKLPDQVDWYMKSGWRELHEENQRYHAAYGNDPEWAAWLREFSQFASQAQTRFNVSPQQIAKPSLVRRWPNPGRMSQTPGISADAKAFLDYLNDWFYKRLSASAHMSLPGLMLRAGHLFDTRYTDDRDAALSKYKSDCIVTATILLVALVSELQIQLGFDLAPRCKFLWGALSPSFAAAEEVYALRYRQRL